jgi:hypothetical protein
VERDVAAFDEGAVAAKTDIDAGRLLYRWGGHSGHWGQWIVGQLAERFGVSVSDGFGVCFVITRSMSFDEAILSATEGTK